jgi:hypothetical protein
MSAVLRSQVQKTVLLAPVHTAEIGADRRAWIFGGELPLAGHIPAGPFVLDLDHPRTKLGEVHAHAGPGQDAGGFDHQQVVQHVAKVAGQAGLDHQVPRT